MALTIPFSRPRSGTKTIWSGLALLAMAMLFAILTAQAAPTRITAPQSLNGTHVYFHEVLTRAFAAVGHEVEIEGIADPARPRMKKMLKSGELTIMWLIQSPQNDQDFVSVDFPLVDGLASRRILLIRPQDQARFDGIKSLEDLRRSGLVAGMGPDWVDLALWHANSLPTNTPVSDPRRLYDMLRVGNRGVDYIPRAAMGILADASVNPGLVPEQRLLLRYEREGRFYLSPQAADLRPALEKGLRILRDNGTLTRLKEKHFGSISLTLQLDRRLVLSLRDDERLN
jgi:hypothetical protein